MTHTGEKRKGIQPDEPPIPPPAHLLPVPVVLAGRPGPQPHNAGITPGWRWLSRRDRPATVRQLQRHSRQTAAVIDVLIDQIEALKRALAARGC